jgi:DNA-binding MarR family transcriptional regulator
MHHNSKKHPAEMDFLIANISHLHHLRAHQLLEGIGLYRGQPPVLFALWEKEGLTQTELAEQMKIAPATVTKMLQRMEKSGFIQRRPDAQDQRVTRVYLTETGRSVQSQVEEIWKTMQLDAFSNFSSDELNTARLILTRIRDNLQNATGERAWPDPE